MNVSRPFIIFLCCFHEDLTCLCVFVTDSILLFLLISCCVCPSSVCFHLGGQRVCGYRCLFSQMNYPFKSSPLSSSTSFSPQQLKDAGRSTEGNISIPDLVLRLLCQNTQCFFCNNGNNFQKVFNIQYGPYHASHFLYISQKNFCQAPHIILSPAFF